MSISEPQIGPGSKHVTSATKMNIIMSEEFAVHKLAPVELLVSLTDACSACCRHLNKYQPWHESV